MSCHLVVNNTTKIPVSVARQKSSVHLFNSRILKCPSLHTSSSPFRTRAIAQERGYYELLGVSEQVTLDEIKKAYKQLARKYHPDVSPLDMTKDYTKRFIEVHKAYETLSDPSRRAAYDMALETSGRSFDERVRWVSRWQCQVSGLEKRSMVNSTGKLSWGARMRQKADESLSMIQE